MFRRLTVNKYFKYLYPMLKSRYGMSEKYTVGQIEKTIEQCGFSTGFIPYALALFLDKADLAKVINQKYSGYQANKLRDYIAKRFFSGNVNYTYEEAQDFIVGNEGHTSMAHNHAASGD